MGHATGSVALVERKRGAAWYVRFRLPNGRAVQRKLGPAWDEGGRPPAGFYTKRTAKAALRAILTDADRGLIHDQPKSSGRTFADAVALWLRVKEHGDRPVKDSTLRDYTNTARNIITPALDAAMPVEAVTRDALEAYKAARLAKVSRRTVQKEMVMLSGIFDVARKAGWVAANPAADLDKISVRPSGEFNVLDAPQVYAVAEAAESRDARALILVAAFTGLRLGELRALRFCDVRFDLGMIQVHANFTVGGATTPKSGRVRSVPLMDDAAAALDELSRREHFTGPDDLVFPSPAGDYRDAKRFRQVFYGALEAAGLGHLRDKQDPMVVHDLRHTFGTLGAAIWPLHDLQAYMGHASIQTTMIYAHHVPKVTAAAEFTEAIRQATGELVQSPTEAVSE